ncbi:MAG: choice-of-anchor Q domain-containing protein, partial [Pirellulales bacterium]
MLTEGGVRGGDSCSVTLDGSNVADGVMTGETVSVANSIVSGGAFASHSTVTLTDSTITDGGIDAIEDISLVRSTVHGNVRTQYGNVDLSDSTVIAGNVSTVYFYSDIPHPNVTLNNSSIIGGGIDAAKNVTLNNSSISGGSIQFYAGTATLNSSSITGGGVFMGSTQWRNGGTIVVENSRISGSSGSAISSHGDISIRSSTISGNEGIAIVFTNVLFTDFRSPPHSISVIDSIIENNGLGGILSAPLSASLYPSPAASVDLAYSVVRGNGGRGITGEEVRLVNSTVSGNTTTGNGGGILASIVALSNSTVSGNSATGNGGGIWSNKIVRNSPAGPPYTNTYLGAVRLEYSTITNNQAGVGGGIWQDAGQVEIEASIVAGNRASSSYPDLRLGSGPIAVVNSLIGDKAGTSLQESHVFDANGNLIGYSGGAGVIDPRLGPLRYNGGPTPTHALLPGSPAIDAVPYVVPPSAGDTAVHVYELDGSLVDAEGGPSLVPLGGTLTPTGYGFEANQGLNLSLAGIDPTTYSIELVFSWDVLSGGWQKIIDFHNLTNDEGLYTAGNGLHFLNTAFADNLFSPNVVRQLVLTRDDTTKTVRAFIDGTLAWSFADSQGLAVLSGPNQILRFFQDDQVTEQSEAASGFVDRIRIFDRALSSAEVLELFDPPRPDLPANDQRGGPFDRVANGDGQNGPQVDMGAFESQANPLSGDYNFNGAVDAADYSVWMDTVGSTTDLRADGSSATAAGVPDGVVDEQDYVWWKANFGNVYEQGAGSRGQGVKTLSSGGAALAGELRLAGVGEETAEARGEIVSARRELGSLAVAAGPARRSSPAVVGGDGGARWGRAA